MSLREWEPGDGLTCSFAKSAPVDLPCGKPTMTAVSTVSAGPGRGDRTMKSPLCEHHAHGRLTGETPHRVVAEAKKVATQRLIHRRWDEFQRYVDEAITSLTGVEPRSTSRQARAARKVEITDDLLREVAGIYRANVTDRPTEAVAEHFDKAHRTAARYIELAREAGFLGAATRGKAGEQ